jgi:flagella basal body P-ring formation protein FlgA
VNRIALLTLGIVLATPAAAVDLTLKAEATLQRDHAVLGDLLASSPDSIRSGQTLSDVVVLKRSSSGNTITLTRAMLARRLFIARPELRGTINWHGAASITIHTESAPDMDARLVDAAKVELEAYLAGQVKVFVVEPASSRTRPVLPPGEFTFRAQALADRPIRKRMAVAVDIVRNGQPYRTIPIWFAVSATTDVLVAKEDLDPQHPLTDILFERQRLDIASLSQPPVDPASNLRRLRVRRNVAQGAVLLTSDIEQTPPVARNQDIALKVVAGGVTIETQATALSDATIGKSVRVRNPRSGEEFVAIVVAPGMAEVLMR